jgi:Mg2+ and Co2+ transporter CorA
MTQDTEKKTSDDPDALRRDIAEKRRDLGDTVEELAQKADVKAQVKERVDERKEALRETSDHAQRVVSTQASQRGPQIAAGVIAALILLLLLRRRRG